MRRLPHLAASSLLCLGLSLSPACKRNANTGDAASTSPASDARTERPKRQPGMPRPYRLPADPELAAHFAHPDQLADAVRTYAPGSLPGPRSFVKAALSSQPSDLDGRLAAWVDDKRPWTAAFVENQLVVWLPIAADRVDDVAGLLAPKPPVGKFGAVDLQRPAGTGPKLAWLDTDAKAIALADDERGLATAPGLAREYGNKPVRLTITAAQARRFADDVPFSRLELTGTGAHDLKLVLEDVQTDRLTGLQDIADGALTGMLEADQVAVGFSSKYADHDAWVKSTLAKYKRQVDKQNFLVRGTLEDLLRRTGSVLRSWNGRFMVGVGPKNHVLLGFGAADPAKMGGATYYLVEAIKDNVSLARQLGIDLPKVRFSRNKTSAAGHNIAVVALEDAKSVVPKEYWSLVDEHGDLRIALAFPKRTGAGMAVVGPECDEVLAKWLEQIKDATPGSDSTKDLIAATLAADPAALSSLGAGELAKVLSLSAERDPTKLVVRRTDQRFVLTVDGPAAPAAGRRVASP